MEIPKQSGDGLPITSACNSGSVWPSLKKISSGRLTDCPNGIEKFSSVILNMDDMCSQLKDNDASPSVTPLNQLQKNLSHKGSFRGERKAYHDQCKASSSCSVDEMKCQSLVVPICAAEGECRVPKRSRRPCLDPRRVMMIFATLSSIGTMVLIYFTMAIGKVNGDDAQAR